MRSSSRATPPRWSRIARKETDPEMKKTVVQKLSMMQGKVVTDYMQELLSK